MSLFQKKDKQSPGSVDKRVLGEPGIYPCSPKDYSPEAFLSPDAQNELRQSMYLNPLNYSRSMREEHADKYEMACHASIELMKAEIRAQQQRLSQLHPQMSLIDKAKEYVSGRRRKRNPQP